MRKLMNYIMLSCKKATELIEKRQVNKLTIAEKLQLKMHTSMCEACSAYEKQSLTLDKAIKQWIGSKKKPQEKLSEEAKTRILKKIEK